MEKKAALRGRPRDESARERILDAALEILEEAGYPQVTVDAIAERAGVGKATIYRWWPNKAAVVIEAFRLAVAPEIPFPDTGSLEHDIRLQLERFVRMLRSVKGRMLAQIVSAAQNDADVAEALAKTWIGPRRSEARAAFERKKEWHPDWDAELLMDMMYGPLYYRLMTGQPLPRGYSESVAEFALRALGM